jgi:hypothetical protein
VLHCEVKASTCNPTTIIRLQLGPIDRNIEPLNQGLGTLDREVHRVMHGRPIVR